MTAETCTRPKKRFKRMAAETGAGEVIVTSSPEDVARADRIVLPGDGAFPACKQQLDDHAAFLKRLMKL